MKFVVALLAGLGSASGLSAQSTCTVNGLVLRGQPTEVISIGPEGTRVQNLSPEDALEFELVVICENGYLIYASREGRQLRYYSSGCFRVLSGVFGQIHFADPGCAEILGENRFEYSEIIRTGIYQIIYRGRLSLSRL